ncbi:MAG: TetR family transcriptional regulator [Myxococcales bacterium]|nr:TetR family transcriptional regulator [Myxococcales bacterium]
MRGAVTDAILDATEAVAVESGLEAATISAIAERAGVAVGTLYNYFPDREGILSALFVARRAQIAPMIAAAAEATSKLPFEARVRAFIGQLLAIFEEKQSFVRLAAMTDQASIKIKPRESTLMTQILQVFEHIMRDGAARKLFPVSRVPAYARMLHGALKALAMWRLSEGQAMTTDTDLLVDTWLHGIGKAG